MPDQKQKLVQVADLGVIKFPGSMPDDQVAAAIKKFRSEPTQKEQRAQTHQGTPSLVAPQHPDKQVESTVDAMKAWPTELQTKLKNYTGARPSLPSPQFPNEGNEGTYGMFGGDAKNPQPFLIPYSRVQDALKNGYIWFHNDESSRYRNDAAAAKPTGLKNTIGYVQKSIEPKPGGDPSLNLIRAIDKAVFVGAPAFVVSLAKAAYSDATGKTQGELLNQLDPGQIPKGLYDQYQEDVKTDPRMAQTNLVGNLIGMYAAGKLGDVATEKIKSAPIPQESMPSRVNTRVLASNPAGEVRMGKEGLPAIWLSPKSWEAYMRAAHPEEAAPHTIGGENVAMNPQFERLWKEPGASTYENWHHVQELLQKAHEQSQRGSSVIAQKSGRGISSAVQVLREESIHSWQRALSQNRAMNAYLTPTAFNALSTAIPKAMTDHLANVGYGDSSSAIRVSEASARMIAGDLQGVTPAEAVQFLSKYFDAVVQQHGPEALNSLEHARGISTHLLELINDEHQLSKRGPTEGALRSVPDRRTGGAPESDRAAASQVAAPTPGTAPTGQVVLQPAFTREAIEGLKQKIEARSPDRRTDTATRKRISEMNPQEMARLLLFSEKTGLPNSRSFFEAQHESPSAAVARSDADGLKAFNDRFGYAAGDTLLKAKADALHQVGLDAYHDKGDEFMYRGDSPDDLRQKLERAREILRNTVFDVTMSDGKKIQLKGVDFSYGVGTDLDEAERGQHEHKSSREASGERKRGELRGITEVQGSNPEHPGGEGIDNTFHRDDDNPWYLKSSKVASDKMKGPMPADDLHKMLVSNGVKPDEMKWTGLDEFLREKGKDKVTPEELKSYLAANNLQLKEVTLAGPSTRRKYLEDNSYILGTQEQAELARLRREEGDERPRYGRYTLPGGNNYREMLITLPSPNAKTAAAREAFVKKHMDWVDEMQTTEAKISQLRRQMDGPFRRPEMDREMAKLLVQHSKLSHDLENLRETNRQPEFKSAHWDQSNVLGHVRFNDRTGPNGEKILHLEELQSDWHQKGRLNGYQGSADHTAEIARLKKEHGEAITEADDAQADETNLRWRLNQLLSTQVPENAPEVSVAENKLLKAEERRKAAQIAETGAQSALYDLAAKQKNLIPDAPFKKTWPELLLKRMMHYAAENGYAGISWTPGEDQAARYDLSTQVHRIVVIPQEDGNRGVRIHPIDGDSIKLMVDKSGTVKSAFTSAAQFDGKNIADVVGKEIAEKIMSAHEETNLHGVDLKIGGEGMKGFYDKMLPEMADKIGKQFGAKVGNTDIRTSHGKYHNFEGPNWHISKLSDLYRKSEGTTWLGSLGAVIDDMDRGRSFEQAMSANASEQLAEKLGGTMVKAAKAKKVPYLPITDSMRESLEREGQPIFHRDSESSEVPHADVEYWSRQADGREFKTEKEARDWLFERLEYGDKQPYVKDMGWFHGPEKNRAKADSIPLYRENRKFRIGNKPPVSKERIGAAQPDGKTPAVDWYAHDLQDSGKVSEDSFLRDYNEGKKALVYRAYVDPDEMPNPVLAEQEDAEDSDDEAGYDWDYLRMSGDRRSVPPMKIRVTPKGKVEILDGNHRLKLWQDRGYSSYPAWVIDQRKGIKISDDDDDAYHRVSKLSEKEHHELDDLEAKRWSKTITPEQQARYFDLSDRDGAAKYGIVLTPALKKQLDDFRKSLPMGAAMLSALKAEAARRNPDNQPEN